jgi:hypothetical protein
VINLLSTQLRRDFGESEQHAIDLEGATARAVRVVKRLQPDGKKKRYTTNIQHEGSSESGTGTLRLPLRVPVDAKAGTLF